MGQTPASTIYDRFKFNPEARTFPQPYGLIKLHKSPPKLRYITPVVDWINKGIAEYVVEFLNPYVKKIDWILESSKDLVNFLQDVINKQKNKSIYIASFDVQDMYNQIDQNESVQCIDSLARAMGWIDNSNKKKWKLITDLIQWVYDSSFVTYDGKFYHQKKGLPMGSALSPVIANLYMAAIESTGLAEFLSGEYRG